MPAPTFASLLDRAVIGIDRAVHDDQALLDRFKAELDFAQRLAAIHPQERTAWEELILAAADGFAAALRQGRPVAEALSQAEGRLAPIGAMAKTYTVHCVGHAHIDMNWMWNWPETVALVNDTFSTIDRLMDEFPDFRFSQDQASIYQILKDYLPWLLDRVKRRVAEGRWEITASQWVEGEKNMASGESLCRHLLHTRRFFQREFGLPYDAVRIDFEPDTFGHARTVPSILARCGVSRYYFCRTGPGPHAFWWQGPDGSRVLAFDDRRKWYNNRLDPATVTRHNLDFAQETGVKDYLLVFGVGDHGGGPTRQDLRMGVEMARWPIFPQVRFSTTDAFFTALERQAATLPVVDAELGFIFEGCYTSQSAIKQANRRSEGALVETESAALLGRGLAGQPWPGESLALAWRHTLFNQFHDILPGSGAPATYQHAQGLFQEVMTRTSMVKTHALRAIAARIDTARLSPDATLPPRDAGLRAGQGLGAGFGDVPAAGAVSRYGAGGSTCDPIVVCNPHPWPQGEVVRARVWNRSFADGEIAVIDEHGRALPAQILERKPYWWMEHQYVEIAFPVPAVPGLGYRTVVVARQAGAAALALDGVPTCSAVLEGRSKQGAEVACLSFAKPVFARLDNEFLHVEVEQASGSIVHLIDRRSGRDLVPAGERLGLLSYVREIANGMTAWHIGQVVEDLPLTTGWQLECLHGGPFFGVIRAKRTCKDSTCIVDISLAAGTPRLDITVKVDWLERGSATLGMPTLRMRFPFALAGGTATHECPNGHVTRPMDGTWTPSQRWIDISGSDGSGATLVNDSSYGFHLQDHAITVSLLRSSYDPDPLPELGEHTFRFAVLPHAGGWTASDATRAGALLNVPFNLISTDEHPGTLPASAGFAEVLSGNVMVSCLKQAEDSTALVIRLYEMEGRATTAQVRLAACLAADGPAVETDLNEQPSASNTARMRDGVLSVHLPPFATTTVRIG